MKTNEYSTTPPHYSPRKVGVEREFEQEVSELAKRFKNLTPKELYVCVFINHSYKNWQIADKLGCSEHSIENHRSNIRKKFGLKKDELLATFLLSQKNNS